MKIVLRLFQAAEMALLLPGPVYLAVMSSGSGEDRSFLTALYLGLRKELFTYAYRLCGSRQTAEDAVQDAFVSLVPRVSSLRAMQQDRLRAYVFVTVKNAVYRIHRNDEKARHAEADSAADTAPAEEEPLSGYDADALMTALPQLSEREQALLHMKYFLRQSDQEIAEQLQVKPDSVRMLLTRARRRLRGIMLEGGERHDGE